MSIPFDLSFDAPYGEVRRLSPMVSRMLARNPGPFTFKGTGVYLVGADERARHVMVIDPGPLIPEHLDALRRSLHGKHVTHILVTHTHLDHSPAARHLQEWTGATTYAFGPHGSGREDGPRVEEGGDRHFVPDVRVRDGDVIEGTGFSVECVHTPGHTSNHMCYSLPDERALFSGDHVMGWSTTVVAPPDGDMAQYIASLRKLLMRDDRILYPTHGGPVRDPKPFLQAYVDHRLEREAQILDSIRNGCHTIPDIVSQVYAAVDKRLHPAAARSVLAHLIQLRREGRVRSEQSGSETQYFVS